MGYGHVLKTVGDQARALGAYRAAIRLKPDFGEVYWSMANLKVFRFEDAEVAAMQEQVATHRLERSADIHFRFALGKAYEDQGDYDAAWHYYDTGNQRQRKRVSHDPVAMELRHEEIIEVFSREFLASHAGAGCDAPRSYPHRRPAPLRVDADRADPRQSQPGRGHGRAADAEPSRRVDRPLPA